MDNTISTAMYSRSEKRYGSIAILTSGGDAPGMNAAVRSSVAMCLTHGVHVYAIMDGYRGLIKGGDSIKRMSWEDVNDIIQKGGTIIGSAR